MSRKLTEFERYLARRHAGTYPKVTYELQEKPPKSYSCRICGTNYFAYQEAEHEQSHDDTPVNGLTYWLSDTYTQTNKEIAEGCTHVPLIIQLSIHYFCESYTNGLKLPHLHPVIDSTSRTVRWNAKKRKFIKTYF